MGLWSAICSLLPSWCGCLPCGQLEHVRLPSSVPAGADLAGAGLYLEPGRVRGTLGRGWGGRPWLSVLCVTRAFVGYKNLA